MNITKSIMAMLGAAAIAMAAMGSASASGPVTFASLAGGDNTITYTPGGGGGLSFAAGPIFTATYDLPQGSAPTPYNNATVVFTGLQNSGATAVAGSAFDQSLTGGTFNISQGNTLLLSGNFTGADLTGLTGANSKSAFLNSDLYNVSYTGGLFQKDSGVASTDSNNAFSLSFLKIPAPPGLSVTNGHLNGFQASGSGQFQGTLPSTTVPEPATTVPFVLGGLGLLGLVVRKTRRTSSAAA